MAFQWGEEGGGGRREGRGDDGGPTEQAQRELPQELFDALDPSLKALKLDSDCFLHKWVFLMAFQCPVNGLLMSPFNAPKGIWKVFNRTSR